MQSVDARFTSQSTDQERIGHRLRHGFDLLETKESSRSPSATMALRKKVLSIKSSGEYFGTVKCSLNNRFVACTSVFIISTACCSASLASENPPKHPILESIRVPIEFNAFPESKWAPKAIDPDSKHDRVPFNIKLKPVIPFALNKNWTLLTYTVARFSSIPWAQPRLEFSDEGLPLTTWSQYNHLGLAVVNPTAVFVPHLSRDLVIGVGPSISVPIGQTPLSDKTWTIGPAVLLSWTTGPWRLGARIHNMFSFAAEDNSNDVNLFILRGNVVYSPNKDWFLISSPIITNNWNHPNGKGWLLPVGGGIGRTLKLGQARASLSVQAYYNLLQPEYLGEELSGDWSVRTELNVVIPK